MKFYKILVIGSLSILLLYGCATMVFDPLDYRTTEHLNLSIDDLIDFEIESNQGLLIIKGDDSLNEIRVTAKLIVPRDEFELSFERLNGKAVLKAHATTDDYVGLFGDEPKIDLIVRVPKHIQLVIDHGSGDISISDMKSNITIHDSSGDIVVKNIRGDINIIDGAGDIEIYTIDGEVYIEDGSGDLQVDIVTGHVTIEDGSGDIDARFLDNGLTILDAGSGELSINDISGGIIIR